MHDVGEPADELPQAPIDAATLFREHAAFVARFVKRLGVPAAAIDDVVQEVFVIAHRKGGFTPGQAQARTWLAAIAVNVARTEHRSRSRRTEPSSPLIDVVGSSAPGPATSFETRQSLARVQAALDTLDADRRAAFILYEIEGASSEHIAAAFDVPLGTVYSRLHHARKQFLAAYQTLSRDEAPRAATTVRSRS